MIQIFFLLFSDNSLQIVHILKRFRTKKKNSGLFLFKFIERYPCIYDCMIYFKFTLENYFLLENNQIRRSKIDKHDLFITF